MNQTIFKRRWWVIGLGLLTAFAAGLQAADHAELTGRLDALVRDGSLGGMRRGVRVELLRPDRAVIYEHDADRPLKPASNQKLITTAAAVSILSPDFTYRTILARRGDDLVVIGSGDPSIGDPHLARSAGESITAVFHHWAERLEALGISEIAGGLIYDDFVFEQDHLPPSWRDKFNLQSWYTAPVGGLNFNDNCVDVVTVPGGKPGEPASVTLIPHTGWIELENNARTAAKGEPVIVRRGDGPITVSVTGPVSRATTPEHPFSLAITDPGAFFASALRTVLASRGIRIAGPSRRQRVRDEAGRLPPDVKVVAAHETRLGEILWRVNKSSQNMFAEALFKTVGAYAGRPESPGLGSYETGRRVIREFLEAKGVPLTGCVLEDGSGLSHSNRTTAQVITSILAGMDQHPHGSAWQASLAVPGEEVGTLRKRMKDLEHAVRAKTGYISGVSALSGYVSGPDDRLYAFSVLCNDTSKASGGTSRAKKLQESICRVLATWEPQAISAGGG